MSKSNDKTFEELETLEQYSHFTPKETVSIIDSIIKAKPLKPKVSHLKGFGKITGKTHSDILIKCVGILNKIRYLETKKVFKLLEKLHGHNNKELKSESIKSFEQLCKYDLFVLQQINYAPQIFILSEVEGWSNQKIKNNIEIIFVIAKELLSPTFEGRSMPDYKTLTLHSGPLVVSDKLRDLRKRTILLLKKIYSLSAELNQKTKTLQVLQEASQTPHSHLYGDDMEQMVLEDTNIIIDFYLEILPDAENEIIQTIEEQKIWFTRRFVKNPPLKIKDLEEAIRSNSSYDMFKVFVGYDGRLNPDYDFNKDRETRTKKVQEFVSDISEDNFEEWRKKILAVVKNYSGTQQPDSYGYFETFLIELGHKKPDLAIRLVRENEKELTPFLISLLTGIWKSNSQKEARDIISNWIDEGKYLYACAFIFVAINDIDEKLLEKILIKARDMKDIRTLNNILRSILYNYPKYKNLKPVFFEIINELTNNKNTQWVNNLWFKGGSIFLDLTEKELNIILDSLLLLSNIDYQAEEILKPIAERYPKKIIDFFHKRVEIKSKRKRDIYDRYDGVPFNFHKLGEALKPHEKIIVPIILTWYRDGGKKHNWLFRWEASHLFEEIFPGFSPVLEKSLIDLIQKGDKTSRGIVLSVLGKYKGEEFLWSIIKTLIKYCFDSKEYEEIKGHLFGFLSQTGVVSGEDGFVRAYRAKKQDVQELKKDANEQVKSFVKEYEDYLDQRITYEQKRTNEQIELMKRGLD